MTRYLIALALVASPLTGQAPTHTLMPVPRSVKPTDDRFRVDSAFTVALPGHVDGRLERAVRRTLQRLEARIAQPLSRALVDSAHAGLVINVGGPGFTIPDLEEDESYRLVVTANRINLTAATVVGAMRGMETLLQLHTADARGFFLPGVDIADSPRFKWRGVLVDVARHFHPPPVIKRILDGMAVIKLNVLHWHLSEDQGFRVESQRFPRLHQLGSDGNYYTQDEIRDIVAYAADRGIRVVPEFDMPGHTTAWFVGYPELASAPGPYTIERRWGVFPGTIDPTREETYSFLDTFLGEMVPLFPDRYWHVGGDEVEPTQWRTSARIQDWMRRNRIANEHALQTRFNERLFALLARRDRQPVGWDEILQPGLPHAAVIQSWRGTNYLVEAAKQGRRSILSAPYYLDHIKTAAEMYLDDPLPAGHGLTPAQQALVLGGEACMWAEYVTMETVESRIFPRMAAIAERFWSPAHVRDVPDMYRRLTAVSLQLSEVGPTHYFHAERMLARMAPADDVPLLRELLRYARPRGFAGRGTNQLSPLTRLIDAAEPDPLTEWQMLALASHGSEKHTLDSLRVHFRRMQAFDSLLPLVVVRAPIAADGIPVAAALRDLGRVGEEALEYIGRSERAPDSWHARADSVIARTRGKVFGLLRPVGAEAVQALIGRVARR